jgi:mono/diheme cytochrome c family protein
MRMLEPFFRILGLAVLAASCAAAGAQPVGSPTRGELLYTTNCISCHTTEVHWREGKKATDWSSLKAQVRRWQDNAGLKWSDADVEEVARHLNQTIYRYPQTSKQLSLASPHQAR